MAKQVRMVDTSFGEVQLQNETIGTDGLHYCEVYIGSNYDDYVGDVCCSMYDTDKVIKEQIEELLCY